MSALATMESRAWGANRLSTAQQAKLVIGTSPRRSDRFAIGVVSVQLVPELSLFLPP